MAYICTPGSTNWQGKILRQDSPSVLFPYALGGIFRRKSGFVCHGACSATLLGGCHSQAPRQPKPRKAESRMSKPIKKDGVFIALTTEEKDAMNKYLKRHGLKKAQLLRAVLRMLFKSDDEAFPTGVDLTGPRKRVYRIYLTEQEEHAIRERMAAEGWDSEKAFFYSCLREALLKVVVLPAPELDAVHGVVKEIRRVGMNLNQIARAINSGERTAGERLKAEDITALANAADRAVDVIMAILLNAHNRYAWEDERREAEWAKKLWVKVGTIPFQNLDEIRYRYV